MATYASLYCGCGGFDLGFRQAGFRCLGSFDNDPVCIETYLRNLKSGAELLDITAQGFPAKRLVGVDVLISGPPCQGFSTAGKRDPKDPRNKLLVLTAEIAAQTRPRVVVVENVTGVVAGTQRKYWDQLRGKLRREGYEVRELSCNASEMGAAQMRRRMVLLAWNTGLQLGMEIPRVSGGNVADAIANINGAENHSPKLVRAEIEVGKIAKRIGPNQKLCNVRAGSRSVHTWDIPEVFGPTTKFERLVLSALLKLRRRNRRRDVGDADPVSGRVLYRYLKRPVADTLLGLIQKGYVRRVDGYYDLVHTFNGKFRRLAWDRPAPTVDTRFGQPRYFLHPDEDRGFTVREAARLQGFPDSFVFSGAESAQYRQVGNAVPPPMAKCLATFVRDSILSRRRGNNGAGD